MSVCLAPSAFADVLSLPTSAFENTDNGTAPSGSTVPFSSGGVTTRFIFDEPLLSTLSAGSQITGLSFRLHAGNSPNNAQRDFNNHNLTLSPLNSGVDFGSLSTGSYAANMDAANSVVVRSGAMSIPANAFTSGANPNLFSYTVSFTTPYVYDGGALVILLKHDGNTIGGGSGVSYTVDAFGSGFSGYGNSIGKTVFARFSAAYNSANGSLDAPIPVLQLVYTAAVPEPGTSAALGGLGALLCAALRRRPRARARPAPHAGMRTGTGAWK